MFILNAKEDEMTGEMGLSFDMPEIDYPTVANEGLLIAHDIIEHVNGLSKIGTIADELQAIAGVWLTRGQHGEIRRDRQGSNINPCDNVLSDVFNMFTMVASGQSSLITRKKPKQLHEDLEWIGDSLSVSKLREYYESEYDETVSKSDAKDYLNTTLYHMTLGCDQWYKTHADIIAEYGEWGVNQMFWNIADELEPHTKHVEGYEKLQVNVDRVNLQCSVTELHHDEY